MPRADRDRSGQAGAGRKPAAREGRAGACAARSRIGARTHHAGHRRRRMMPSRLGQFAHGVKVLDLSAFLPGPLAALLLADMGADVLKIEPPAGDGMMQIGPRDAAGRPVFYEAVNAGKSLRRMDLKQPEQRAEFLPLGAGFDVLIEGFRPGVMARLGLGYPALREVNPGLIFCSLSGYGAAGPLARAAGHDNNYLASAGVLHRNGQTGPMFFDPPVADVSSSLFG